MSASHIAGNRNSTPEAGSSLRPPSSRTGIAAGHHLRSSADMGGFSSPLANRGIRPSSEVYFNRNNTVSGNPDEMERAAQQWIADIEQYQATLEEMAAAAMDQDFKDELGAIEQWFRVLSEPERTSSLYNLIQQCSIVQIRFFIQVLQQMAKKHPSSALLSPSNFGDTDPMSQKMNAAMSKLNVDGGRNSLALGRPPPSPGAPKRNSILDPETINRLYPEAVAAIASQKDEFTQSTGLPPTSNRNSTVTIGDRSSLVAPSISAPQDNNKATGPQPPSSPWRPNSDAQQSATRPKSSSGQHQPMGQFSQPPPSAGLRSPRLPLASDGGSVQSTTLAAPDQNSATMPMLSPYAPGGSWASQLSTPMVPNFSNAQQSQREAEMVANATAMKLAALSTVNNRIQLDDVRKYRRARSSEGNGGLNNLPMSPGVNVAGMPQANFVMTDDQGQLLTPQQAAALQAQQLAAMQGRRSRPNSPGLAMQGQGLGAMGFTSPQNNGFLSAYNGTSQLLNSGLMGQFGMGMGHGEGYISDHSEINRGRSPRGRRGSSKPPEDPTDASLLQDIPTWLRSLRLHKYTDNLKDLKWQELVELDDEGLEKRGVNALGARRKMLKVFEQVRDAKADGKLN